ncbi:SRPBCC family protein [Nocardia asteroides]|uniref:SRPBCC family protein n=1 Tax=Nocardia asteroides TaxID=1824 RepID=UPI0037C65BDC
MARTEPQHLEFAETAPYTIDYTHPCPASASAAYAVFKDNRGGARWLGWFVTAVEPTSSPEHGLDSTREVTFLYGLGKLSERFIGWDEPRLWSFTATEFRPGVFSKFVERVTFEPVDANSCLVHYRAGFDLSPSGRPFARLIVAWLQRAIVPTLERMSQLAISRTP